MHIAERLQVPASKSMHGFWATDNQEVTAHIFRMPVKEGKSHAESLHMLVQEEYW